MLRSAADSLFLHKIGERAGMLFSRADQIAMLITGKNANPQVLQQLEAQGVSILRV